MVYQGSGCRVKGLGFSGSVSGIDDSGSRFQGLGIEGGRHGFYALVLVVAAVIATLFAARR